MYDMTEILKYIIPMIVLGGIFYFLIEKLFNEIALKHQTDLRIKDREIWLPQKYQAYERMAIFMERIRPTNLVRRIPMDDNADMYELSLINAIQEEFDHNISQQIYIDPETWNIIFSTKNALQNFVKTTRGNLGDKSDSDALRMSIIQNSMDIGISVNGAMLKLQRDIQGS